MPPTAGLASGMLPPTGMSQATAPGGFPTSGQYPGSGQTAPGGFPITASGQYTTNPWANQSAGWQMPYGSQQLPDPAHQSSQTYVSGFAAQNQQAQQSGQYQTMLSQPSV